MAKILKIIDYFVTVGLDDGSAIEIYKDEFDFEISEGMQVLAYKNNNKYIFVQEKENIEPPVHGRKYVNKIIYAWLFFLCGELGLQAFYARSWIRGLTSLVIFIILVSILKHTITEYANIIALGSEDKVFSALLLKHPDLIINSPFNLLLVCVSATILLIWGVITRIRGITLLCTRANKHGRILVLV